MGDRKKRNKIMPSKALPTPGIPQPSNIHATVSISFKHARGGANKCLSHCDQAQVKSVVECLRKVSNLSWIQMSSHDGLKLKQVPPPWALPEGVPPDVQVQEVRATLASRVFFYRDGAKMVLLWFDPIHEGFEQAASAG